eukprot:3520500-Rhodomonas_salina.1
MEKNEKKSLFCLLAFCKDTTNCRRKMILRYWGQGDNDFACGMCDNCTKKSSLLEKETDPDTCTQQQTKEQKKRKITVRQAKKLKALKA